MQLPSFGRLRALTRRFRRAGEEHLPDLDDAIAADEVEPDVAEELDDTDESPADDGPRRAALERLRAALAALVARLPRRRRSDDDASGEEDDAGEDLVDSAADDLDDDTDDGGPEKKKKTKKVPVPKGRAAVGLLVRKDRLLVTRGSGRKATVDEYPFEPGGLGALVAMLREDGVLGGKVVCSIEGRRLYTVTRAIDPEEEGLGPSEILARDIGRLEGGIVADSEEIKLPSGQHKIYAACPGEVARELWRGLAGLRPRDLRLVPTDHAVQRLAASVKGSPRRWRKELRVLVDGSRGVALIVVMDHVVASRAFLVPESAPADTRGRAIEIAAHGLVTWAREEFGVSELDGAVLHAEDTDESTLDGLAALVSGDAVAARPVGLDSASLALALPEMARKRLPEDLDVFRDLHAPSGFKENFPARAVALMLTTLTFCSWLLWDEVTRLENEISAIDGQLKALMKRVGTKPSDIAKLHEVRTIEWNTVTSFVGERVFWSDVLDRVPELLPENVILTDLNGRDRLMLKKGAAGTQAPRRLLMTCRVDVNDENVSPPEVGLITDRLRSDEAFGRSFPRVTGANVKMMPGPTGTYARMTFTCLPGNG